MFFAELSHIPFVPRQPAIAKSRNREHNPPLIACEWVSEGAPWRRARAEPPAAGQILNVRGLIKGAFEWAPNTLGKELIKKMNFQLRGAISRCTLLMKVSAPIESSTNYQQLDGQRVRNLLKVPQKLIFVWGTSFGERHAVIAWWVNKCFTQLRQEVF